MGSQSFGGKIAVFAVGERAKQAEWCGPKGTRERGFPHFFCGRGVWLFMGGCGMCREATAGLGREATAGGWLETTAGGWLETTAGRWLEATAGGWLEAVSSHYWEVNPCVGSGPSILKKEN